LRLQNETRFYYPDVSVVCKSNSSDDAFQDEPVVIIEVLSKRTRRIDEGERKDAYMSIPSLCLYIMVEQVEPAVVTWRRTVNGFVREDIKGMDGVISLGEVNTSLQLQDLYDGVEFVLEEDD
jgi:Uma2 family endonuclease